MKLKTDFMKYVALKHCLYEARYSAKYLNNNPKVILIYDKNKNLINTYVDKRGRQRFNYRFNKRKFFIYVDEFIVASMHKCFLGDRNWRVVHKDGDLSNNSVTNLDIELVNKRIKFPLPSALELRKELETESLRKLAKKYGCSKSTLFQRIKYEEDLF